MGSNANRKKRAGQATQAAPSTNRNALYMLGGAGLALVALLALGVFVWPQLTGANVAAPADAPVAEAASVDITNLPLEVSIDDAYALREDGAFILDVRTVQEWEVDGHIPDATLIVLDDLPTRVDEVPRDEPVVIICRSGNRSAVARDILLDAGFTNVTSVAGGMNQWKVAGYEYVTGP